MCCPVCCPGDPQIMKKKLTELAVARLKPPASGRLEVWDTTLPGFGLRLTAAGRRSYVVALRKPGAKHPSRLKVGEPGEISLADARAQARELMANPVSVPTPKTATVAEAVEEFVARHVAPNRRERSGREAAAQLRREFVAYHSAVPIQAIRRPDILAALDRVTDRGSAIAANRLRANLARFFGWAADRGHIEASPVAGVRAPARERSRDRVLTPGELAAVWEACDRLAWPFGPLVQLLAITAQRRDEVAHLAWPDLDLAAHLWTLPRELAKADRVHEVPLAPLAMEIVASLPRISDGLVFPARKLASDRPVSGFSKVKARLDQLSGVTDWRLHDLRRTAASGMARLAHPPHVVAAVLNHAPGSVMGVSAVYVRHRFADEKRAALDAWAREIERVILGRGEPKVVTLRG